jgi:hypothetical protein
VVTRERRRKPDNKFVKQTSTAPTVTISGNTYYNSYIFGDDAIFSVFLGKNPEDGSKNYDEKLVA